MTKWMTTQTPIQNCEFSPWPKTLNSSRYSFQPNSASSEFPGVPYILVNGVVLENEKQLIQAVCKAYQGTMEGMGALVTKPTAK